MDISSTRVPSTETSLLTSPTTLSLSYPAPIQLSCREFGCCEKLSLHKQAGVLGRPALIEKINLYKQSLSYPAPVQLSGGEFGYCEL
ncbi:hypothetical protein J4Q44_G00281860 [Coregonus suidteri]|uniref:Uncharacterized protein n=1 Tax=Coregonus suidteri TaxID=861788 RepID=A0AAN8QLG2_9TELE